MRIELLEAEVCGLVTVEFSTDGSSFLTSAPCVQFPPEITTIGNGNSVEVPDDFIKQELNIKEGLDEWLFFHETYNDTCAFLSAIGKFFRYNREEEVAWAERLEDKSALN
jgi:hypothetical protein